MYLRIFVCLLFVTACSAFSHAQNDPCVAFNRGANFRFVGRWDEAIKELTKAIDNKCPELGKAYYLRGEARWAKKDYEGAWADATKAIPLLTEPAAGHLFRGQIAFARSDLNTALTEFTKSIQLDPRASETYVFRAKTRAKLGDETGAVADFARVLQLGGEGVPENYLARAKAHVTNAPVSPHYTKGIELFNAGDNVKAIAAFTRAIAAEPKRSEYYAARANVNLRLRKLPAGLLDLDRSIALGGTYQAHASRASIHVERGSYDKAIDDLNRAVQLSIDSPDANAPLNHEAGLAGAYDLSGKASVFRSRFNAEDRQYHFYNALYDDALNDKAGGLFGLAIAKFTAAIGYFPDRVEYLAERGQLWMDVGKPQQGLADFDRSLVVAPKKIYIHVYRGKAFHAMKRYADAVAAAGVAIDRLPEDDPLLREAYAVRAAANCALGRKEAAAEDEANFGMLADSGSLKTRCR